MEGRGGSATREGQGGGTGTGVVGILGGETTRCMTGNVKPGRDYNIFHDGGNSCLSPRLPSPSHTLRQIKGLQKNEK